MAACWPVSRARAAGRGRRPVLAAERRLTETSTSCWRCRAAGEIERVLALERFAHAFVARTRRLTRARGGRPRGHGDLRAEHVLLEGRVQVVDCIEFDRGLRELDVADDLAFLVMDLVASGGERFDEAGARVPGRRRRPGRGPADRVLRRLPRAGTRQGRAAARRPASGLEREHGQQSAPRGICSRWPSVSWRATTAVVDRRLRRCRHREVHSPGRSPSARALPHLSSDMTRKRLAGIGVRSGRPAAYSADFNCGPTPSSVGARGGLAANGGAIVDATFRHRADRQAFAAAFAGAAARAVRGVPRAGAVLAERAA